MTKRPAIEAPAPASTVDPSVLEMPQLDAAYGWVIDGSVYVVGISLQSDPGLMSVSVMQSQGSDAIDWSHPSTWGDYWDGDEWLQAMPDTNDLAAVAADALTQYRLLAWAKRGGRDRVADLAGGADEIPLHTCPDDGSTRMLRWRNGVGRFGCWPASMPGVYSCAHCGGYITRLRSDD